MTYAVPLVDGSFGIAQAGEAMGGFLNVIHVALFSNRLLDPSNECPLDADDAVSLTTTWRKSLNRGDWLSLDWRPEIFRRSDFPAERLAASGYVGAKTYDSGILNDFLSAFHGLVPWNVMHDPNFYDKLLRSGVERPSGAVILDEAGRERHRKEVLHIDV